MAEARDLVYISYSKKDKPSLEALKTMLMGMHLNIWDNTDIIAGGDWKEETTNIRNTARIAVLLISPDYLVEIEATSKDTDIAHEFDHIWTLAEAKTLTLFPILVRTCAYEESKIVKYYPKNNLSRPLDQLTAPNRGIELMKICKKIKATIDPVNSVYGRTTQVLNPLEGAEDNFYRDQTLSEQPTIPNQPSMSSAAA